MPFRRAASGSLAIAVLLAAMVTSAAPKQAVAGDGCVITNQRTGPAGHDLEAAVVASDPGDTLIVDGVCYSFNTVIVHDLTLRGADDEARVQADQHSRAITVSTGTVAITELDVFGGRVTEFGGAIRVGQTARLTIRRSDIVGGQSVADADSSAAGGGIAVDFGGRLTLIQSSVTDNVAESQESVRAAMGGGIWISDDATVTIINSTIARNTARSPDYSAEGGGISVLGGKLKLIHATIVDNTATALDGDGREQGGGIRSLLADVTVDSSLIARNSAGAGPDCWGEFTSAGHNLIRNRRGCQGFKDGVKRDIVGTKDAPIAVKLGVLGWHGGTTRTILVKAGSPVIDAAGRAPCLRSVDQRGVSRPKGPRCDIGSFEKKP